MEPYRALTLLSLADGRHVAPGDLVELDAAAAAALLAAGAIEPLAAPQIIHATFERLEISDVEPAPPPAPTRPRRRA